MKKIVSVLLVVVMCLGMLVGCGAEKTENVEKTEVEQEERNKEVSSSVREINFNGYSFSIPERWEEGNSSENALFFYPETGMLMVQFSPIEGESILDKSVQQQFTKGFSESYENFEFTQESIVQVAGQEAYQQTINFTRENVEWQGTLITYDCPGGWMTFIMFTVNGEDSYTKEFEEILNSITNESGLEWNEQATVDDVIEDIEEPDVTKYSSGMYKIGTDMPAGEYLITSSGGYYEVASDSTGSLESIVTNDNYENRAYVTVQDGQYFTFDGVATPVGETVAYHPIDGIYPEGMYLVGKDIPAGEYRISATESGYYEVTTDSLGGLYSIVTNENFEGNAYLTVSDGQYLKLNRAQIFIN